MNKRSIKKAVALQYDHRENQAPKVTAKGEGHIADKIINEGTKHDVKIQEDKALVQLLYQLDIDEQIPETLYPIVAEVFALIYRAELNARMTKDD